ncbi:PREDICTED: receptor-like cytosolic serine/threonine-protein kinase RBK2 [Ipomoea nil]|uniref:receptor-like cytosolic serine/threonine-protein kinase RBK2 n=1 Tax=Ipomoea nil TaxID=35883 RepID=UPI000901BCC8|nr:PREDICTED: receptor-like cytosolic serine/threonine-protein kinase RBK2 [Ipomoea nil]
MGKSTVPSASQSEDDVEENEEMGIAEIAPKVLFCSSISLTAEEMECLSNAGTGPNEDPTKVGGKVLMREAFDVKKGSEATSSKVDPFHIAPNPADEKNHSQWHGFIRKIKKGQGMSLHTFHPSIPSLPTMKKAPKKRIRKSLPSLPPQIDGDLVSNCFETNWTSFSLAELQKMTDNFSSENVIGEGGYSEVYKGNLEDGRLVAVKRLIRGSPEEITADYLSELGILVHVNHPNIAGVIGYGVEGGMHLVLPLSPNGSLATLLNDQSEKLLWQSRYNIALGTASGLSYLHEACQRRIIHRDIKAANILLSQEFEAQISDFGLAKWLPEQWSHLTVSQFEGTFGYLPPELFMHGIVDEKTDVYAYGVLLLEIITGRQALDQSHNSVVMWAKPFLLQRNIAELADPALHGVYDLEQMTCMALAASLCIQQSAADRPTMSKVVKMLTGEEDVLQITAQFHKRMDEFNELLDTQSSSSDGS